MISRSLIVAVVAGLILAACTPASVVRPPEVAPGVSTHLQVGGGSATGDVERFFLMCSKGIEGCIGADMPGINGELAVNYGFTPGGAVPWSIGVVGNSLRLQVEGYAELLGGPGPRGGIGGRVGIPVGATGDEQVVQLYGVWSDRPPTWVGRRLLLNPTVSYRRLRVGENDLMTVLMLSPAATLELVGDGVRFMPSVSLSYLTGVSSIPDGESRRYHAFLPMITVGLSIGQYD